MKRLFIVYNPRSSHYGKVKTDIIDRLAEGFALEQTSHQVAKPLNGPPDEKQDDGAAHNLPYKLLRHLIIELLQRERHRHAHTEDEEREHQVGRCQANPLGMFQRPIDMTPRARVVYQQHACDGDTAQDVERQ